MLRCLTRLIYRLLSMTKERSTKLSWEAEIAALDIHPPVSSERDAAANTLSGFDSHFQLVGDE
jgi:hypothetical protein